MYHQALTKRSHRPRSTIGFCHWWILHVLRDLCEQRATGIATGRCESVASKHAVAFFHASANRLILSPRWHVHWNCQSYRKMCFGSIWACTRAPCLADTICCHPDLQTGFTGWECMDNRCDDTGSLSPLSRNALSDIKAA